MYFIGTIFPVIIKFDVKRIGTAFEKNFKKFRE